MTRDELLRTLEQAKAEGWTSLDLSDWGLTELPDTIGELTALESLDLSGNDLTELPATIGQLQNLTSLVLGRWDKEKSESKGNQLSALPPEIGQLTNLSQLDLSSNQLSALPPEIGQLTNLSSLSLSSNQLSALPKEIGQLTNLSQLDLSSNQLSALPKEIGQLTNLSQLDLSSNQLSALPTEIQQLTRLRKLDLRENSLEIPPEILGTSRYNLGKPAAILDYYFQLQQEPTQALNEAKLLVVGQGSVGKTSLINRLLYNRFNPQENKTEGIQIQPWPIQLAEHPVQLNVWDFGGQQIMHATHQFFLTKRSLYLLVLDTRLGEEENRLDYWLKIIESFGGDSPILVLGNKGDQAPLDLDRRGLQRKYPNIQAFVQTSCQTGAGIDDLKAAIAEEIDKLPHVKDELPQRWLELKQQLQDMQRDYLPYDPDYLQLCQQQGIDNPQQQQTLIRLLHDLGVVLNFHDDPRLEDTNILNPVWVANGVYQILNDNALMTQHQGVLERTMLDRILDRTCYPRTKQLFIIDMMRKFELCFDLVRDEKFLIPELLSKEEPDTGSWENALAFQYCYAVLPDGIISRFIVRAYRLISKKTYWRSGVVLAREGSRALAIADREAKTISIQVTGSEFTQRSLLSTIRAEFDHIHSTITGLEVAEKVPLPENPEVVVDYQHLLTLERKNIDSFIPEGLTEPVSVKQLLDGVESAQSRQQRQREREVNRKPGPPPSTQPIDSDPQKPPAKKGFGEWFQAFLNIGQATEFLLRIVVPLASILAGAGLYIASQWQQWQKPEPSPNPEPTESVSPSPSQPSSESTS